MRTILTDRDIDTHTHTQKWTSRWLLLNLADLPTNCILQSFGAFADDILMMTKCTIDVQDSQKNCILFVDFQVLNKLLSLATNASQQKFTSNTWSNMLISTGSVRIPLDLFIETTSWNGQSFLEAGLTIIRSVHQLRPIFCMKMTSDYWSLQVAADDLFGTISPCNSCPLHRQ